MEISRTHKNVALRQKLLAMTKDEKVREFDDKWFPIEEANEDLIEALRYRYSPLAESEVRLLRLKPATSVIDHVQCELTTFPSESLPPFIAIQNARGYRDFQEVIEVNDHVLPISSALERFFRFIRDRIPDSTYIWVRHVCVQEFDEGEQKLFWTRDYSDMMYSRATELLDMHETNNLLIENGYFERIIDSRYRTWKKEWIEMPENIVLPQICPIRLGSNPNNDDPTKGYQYLPLDMFANEIRVLCVLPSEDPDARIIMHVAHCPIKCDVTFASLSYRWGSESETEQVILNGQFKTIRSNLADAIRAVRLNEQIVPIWADAVSINQEDLAEKSRQIPRMDKIYDNSVLVYCYPDKPAESDSLAFEFVQELIKHPMIRTNDEGEFHFGDWNYSDGGITYGENTMKRWDLAQLCYLLYAYLTKEYFRRIWVVQEVAWAANPTIIAGAGVRESFENLDMAAYNLQDMFERDPSLKGAVQVENLAFPRILFFFRHLISRGANRQLTGAEIRKGSPGFLEALVLTRSFECTDPRDKIFALWSVAQDKDGLDFRADYALSYETVYRDFARAWINQHRSLDILGSVEASVKSREFYKHVPSWCPNWNVPSEASCLVRKDFLPTRMMFTIPDQQGPLYSADGVCSLDHTAPEFPAPGFHEDKLHCTGIIIDEIIFILDDAPQPPSTMSYPRCDPPSFWRFRCWFNAIVQYFHTIRLDTYDDVPQAAWAMQHGDLPEAWFRVESIDSDVKNPHPNKIFNCVTSLSRHVLFYGGNYDPGQAWMAVKNVLRGRRPFASKNGYMGLAPEYLAKDKVGDQGKLEIAILAGCSVPVILRMREDETYELVGTCFLQGWMDGKWTETMMGAESPMEFWAALSDGPNIVIT